MNTKLFEVLKTKCKSFGLTKKALEELTELGSSELTDESTDEEIAAKADLLVPYAKAMQGQSQERRASHLPRNNLKTRVTERTKATLMRPLGSSSISRAMMHASRLSNRRTAR